MERTKTTPRWENLKGLEVDTFAREMINGRRRTEEDGRKRRGGGMEWRRLISPRRAGTLSLPCSTVLSPSLLSPFVLQKYLSGWERE